MVFQRGQRHRLFVSRTIQGNVMGRFALYWFGYHFALWHGMLLYGYIRGSLLQNFSNGGGMPFWTYYARFYEANNTVLFCAAAICPFLLWDTLRVTHRIAGPIERFKATLQKLTRGEEVREIQLRDNDMLQDLRDSFNEYLASRQQSPRQPGKLTTTDMVALDRVMDQVKDESETSVAAGK
jgi:methyl-accepting chemotaxis protein